MSGRLYCTALVLLLPLSANGDNPKRVAAGKLVTETGTALSRKPTDVMWDWTPITKDAEVFSEDQIIGLNESAIDSLDGSVRMTMRTDLANRSPFPIIETAIRLNPPSKDADLDVWLDRGRIDLTNIKKAGATTVRVHFRTRVWDLKLEKPGTRAVMEIYGRWPQGSRFNPKPKPDEGPETAVVFLVLNGEVQRSCSRCSVAMAAPPGPSLFSWDSIHGDDIAPKKLDKAPDWVAELDPKSVQAQAALAKREAFRKTLITKGLGDAIADLLDSKDPEARRIGVYALGAFDQLPSLGAMLRDPSDPEMWNSAVVAARHWLGRGPGQELKLFNLLQTKDFTKQQAGVVIQLLLGFSEEDYEHPSIFKLLIDLLQHDKPVIRGLAYYHLLRHAPGVKVKFNPNGEAADRARAVKEYKDAIPEGKLPPAPK